MAYTSINSPVGALTVFAEDDAIVALEWGRVDNAETSDLLGEAARQLVAYFDGRLNTFDLPLKPHGTAFQKSVWQLMEEIPIGHTRTYSDLAADLKSGARAVGTACGRNPVPLIIPCHRIVGAAGSLGGYSGAGGIVTKRLLLDLEQSHSLAA